MPHEVLAEPGDVRPAQGLLANSVSNAVVRLFAEYLGRPGVICVATAVEDQVGALVDLDAEMMRRTSAKAVTRLNRQFPELLGVEDARYHSDRRPPALQHTGIELGL